ncbi:MAG TPA: M28 family metallopeptidase [Longimicrobiaceae bacterium]|nr:M28 family metallopeptidase [Longimicrobiaceae bacterium]
MRWLAVLLGVQVALGGALIALAATDNIPFAGGGDGGGASARAAERVPPPRVDRFNARAAFASVRRQVALGPRPAGSPASRALGERIRRKLPRGRFQAVPGGLRNVFGTVPGKDPRRVVVVGAHYDTKDQPGFLGANDGASGTAILTQLARTVKPRRLGPTLVFIAFDGEESPAGVPDQQFERFGLRGSKVAAPAFRRARAMILLDFVGERGLRIPREGFSDARLWHMLRSAARRVGVAKVFPDATQGPILDDHVPFIRQGVPSIDLIDFDFPCFHRNCDDLSRISPRSLDAVGETVLELLRRL